MENSPQKTILIAEDEDFNFIFISEVLKTKGYKIVRACDGQQAIDICISDNSIDLILMDLRMPVKDGYESAGVISRLKPGLPIIAQTAYGFLDEKDIAISKGCTDCLTKPFSKAQLISIIEKYI